MIVFLIAFTIGILAALGVLQILRRDSVRIVIGFYMLWNAVNILIISVAVNGGRYAPIIGENGGPADVADPLVQAVVLTAIVITLGFTALFIALLSWLSARKDSIDVFHHSDVKH